MRDREKKRGVKKKKECERQRVRQGKRDGCRTERERHTGGTFSKKERDRNTTRQRARETDRRGRERDVVRHRQRWRKRARWKSDIQKALHFNTLV